VAKTTKCGESDRSDEISRLKLLTKLLTKIEITFSERPQKVGKCGENDEFYQRDKYDEISQKLFA